MRIYRNIFLVATLVAIASCNTNKKTGSPSAQKKIVFIPGNDSHGVGEHEHLGGSILLAKLLNENVPGVNAVVTEQGWPVDTTILNDAATIVMYSDGGDRHMVIPHQDQIDRLMKKGVGLVCLHYSVEIPKNNGGDNFLNWIGGYFETDWSVNPFWTAKFDALPTHSITRGVQPFEVNDEWYYHMRFQPANSSLEQILTALPPASTLEREEGPHSNNPHVREAVLERKEAQTVAWAYTRGDGGRGFGFTGGHVHKNWMNDDYRKLVLNAIIWTAGIDVPANGINSKTPTIVELEALQKKPIAKK